MASKNAPAAHQKHLAVLIDADIASLTAQSFPSHPSYVQSSHRTHNKYNKAKL